MFYYFPHLGKCLEFDKLLSLYYFQTECGCQYTESLERMIKDMTVSNTIMEKFKEHIAGAGVNLFGVDLSVRVLTTGFWPIQSVTAKGIIPQAALEAFEVFKR